ncbi:Hsp20/alpha crystallin family protein [Pseudonocardia alni]|uniref:Hsp20/alpha crystallin family protein n=1 Tax=Pseudonocardia TaxID=1847 RepID=UPI0006CB7C16|nr:MULTISPECIES: Hsp20/alpha crystallin family protein [unclassified Pseudonocardia]ALE81331.1 hypothetical protein WY02_26460 [Pseudonocardia sp. AL041005-10]MCO7196793.1 Hsp20/alpha crystallin family protein [Pseudonocardia sp. McavD-2-B]
MSSTITRRAGALPGALTEMERMVDDWFRAFPVRRPVYAGRLREEAAIRVDEFVEDGALVVRAELPGVDPAADVSVTVADGLLTVRAERGGEEERSEDGYRRRELWRGTMSRVLQLPEGVVADDIAASYTDGILEIRVPMPEPPAPAEATMIPISTG